MFRGSIVTPLIVAMRIRRAMVFGVQQATHHLKSSPHTGSHAQERIARLAIVAMRPDGDGFSGCNGTTINFVIPTYRHMFREDCNA